MSVISRESPPPQPDTDYSAGMPELYQERTTPEERARHGEKLRALQGGGGQQVEAHANGDGDWHFEIVTMDWDDPGLLDRIFEAIVLCYRLEHGISIQRARIFTGDQGQVVNILHLRDRQGRPLKEENAQLILGRLREIQPGERGVLETIQNFPFRGLIPLLTNIPRLNNEISAQFTCLEIEVARISNRFTSVLMHFLSRSELWLNIQVAEFTQAEKGLYRIFVVDKAGKKLSLDHFTRQSLVHTLEGINNVLSRFNIQYIRRDWMDRIERNNSTIFRSRPDFSDYLKDLDNIRQLNILKGLEGKLSPLVEVGLLLSKDFYFLKQVEAFVTRHAEQALKMVEEGPTEEDVEMCRVFFENRRRALRILSPLFQRLMEVPSFNPALSPTERIEALCEPFTPGHFVADEQQRLYLEDRVWLGEPLEALDAFLLMARTGCTLRPDVVEIIEAGLEAWNEYYIAENKEILGEKFSQVIDESVRQGNTAFVLRSMRTVGMLQRYIPGFADIQGRIHVVADHAYTVDEHTFVVIEALLSLRMLGEVLPEPGSSALRRDYLAVKSHNGLKNYARKYALEMRKLERVTSLRNHPAARPFYYVMEEALNSSLDYLVEVNLLEHGYDACMVAMMEVEDQRRRLDSLIRLFQSLPFSEVRILVLTGLFHDIKKPAVDHGTLGAAALNEVLSGMGMQLPEADVARLRWLIAKHLDIRPLINEIGAEGEAALLRFVEEAGDVTLVRSLILFTFADRMAVRPDQNARAHDAMMLSHMLSLLEKLE